METLREDNAIDLTCPFVSDRGCVGANCMAWSWDDDGVLGQCLLIPNARQRKQKKEEK